MNGRFEVEIYDPVGVGIDDLLEVASLEGYDPFRVITVDPEGVKSLWKDMTPPESLLVDPEGVIYNSLQ
jgi:hypothetical protein